MKAALLRRLAIVGWVLVLGCGGAQLAPTSEYRALLGAGKYTQARAAAINRGGSETLDRAVIATSLIAESQSAEQSRAAVNALVQGNTRLGATAASAQVLDLVVALPQPIAPATSIALVLAALGACGQGPFADQFLGEGAPNEGSRDVAIRALESFELALDTSAAGTINARQLLAVWNGCFTLLGGDLAVQRDTEAWTLFQSIGNLAVVMAKSAPDDGLSKALLSSAILVVERNPEIAIAARCDIASPYDRLKTVLVRELELRQRLELAVAAGAGCSRGTYAPAAR